MGAFKLVRQTEGLQGFYRGMTPAVVASSIAWGGYFYFYERSKERRLGNMAASSKLGSIDHVLAGIESGSIMVLITNPLWLIRTRLALQDSTNAIAVTTATAASNGNGISNNISSGGSSSGSASSRIVSSVSNSGSSSSSVSGGGAIAARRYKGLIDAFVTIWREEGPRGLYRGAIPALFLTTHGSIQFAVYEYLKVKSSEIFGPTQPMWVTTIAGGFSKIVASTVTYPYQVIKSRLQQRESGMTKDFGGTTNGGGVGGGISSTSASAALPEPKYTNTRDAISKTWRNEGFIGFFRGFSLNVLKVAPSAAITFVIYEETLKFLRGV